MNADTTGRPPTLSAIVITRNEAANIGACLETLAFCDEQDSPLLKMELMVPKEVMAKDLADRFRKNTEQLYASVINALFEAPREKKE